MVGTVREAVFEQCRTLRIELKKEGIDDALIQPFSGHASRQSLEIYSRLAIATAQAAYADAMGRFPV